MMRRFIVLGHRAVTAPVFDLNDLCGGAGRLDILLRCVNSAFFLSHNIRKDVELYLLLLGEPNPPKRIKFVGSELKYLNPDERSTGALVRTALMRNAPGNEVKSTPGIHISDKCFEDTLVELSKTGTDFIYLKEEGEDIRTAELKKDTTFILSDSTDLTDEEESTLSRFCPVEVSLGLLCLHSDHCITIVQNELDRRMPITNGYPIPSKRFDISI